MKFLSKRELAELLHLSEKTVDNYRMKGLLPKGESFSRKLLFNETDVLKSLKKIKSTNGN